MRRLRAGVAMGAASVVYVGILAVGCRDVNYVVLPADGAVADVATDRRRPPVKSSDDDDDGDDDDDDDVADATAADAKGGDAALDAGSDARAARDANGPGATGTECSFNHDCQLALRCECDGICACTPGARGTTAPGQPCADGQDCTSAVCLEGTGGQLRCSDECQTASECPPELPRCANVSLVGRICVRAQP
ncbi:MAG: hypothetical protein KIT84_10800 [Labilithrix sp.]|nr:hypothetical protein [Labilithrix sp.]MCW5811495.1 hypothetical protein [Labilithrix sp.]